MPADAPVRANLTGTLLPRLALCLESGERYPDQAYCTQTTKLLLAGLPAASVAEQFTVVLPGKKVEPDSGVQVTGTGPSTSSLAVTVKVTLAPPALVAIAVMSPGVVITGATLSAALTVRLTVAMSLSAW